MVLRSAVGQVRALLRNERLPFAGELTVEAVDANDSRARYLSPTGGYDNHVVLARVATNRTFHRALVVTSA